MTTYISVITSPGVEDDSFAGPILETDVADDVGVPELPDPRLLVDVDPALALKRNKPADVAFPDPGIDVLIGRTVIEVLAGQLLTSGAQLVITIVSVVYTIPAVPPVDVGVEVELLLTGYGALDVCPRLSEELPEAPVGEAETGTEAPVPMLLVRKVVLFVAVVLDRVIGAEPVGPSGTVGPTFVVELVLRVDDEVEEVDVLVKLDELDVVEIKELTELPVDDDVVEAEVLDWLEEFEAGEVTELLVDEEVVGMEVLGWLEDVETDKAVPDEEDVELGKAEVVVGF